MKNTALNWVRLPLQNVDNCRELGGYPTIHGQQTNWHTFLRSSHLSKSTGEDIQFLLDYGVKTVIDLRGHKELVTHKNPLSEVEEVNYTHIPFAAGEITDIMKAEETVMTLSAFYIELLKQEKTIQRIFNTIYQAKEGCVLFHCTAGKDRTGVLAMLLLGLADVDKKDILANYEVTHTYLNVIDLEEYRKISPDIIYSNKDQLEIAYEYIINHFGSINGYLQSVGIDTHLLNEIKERILLNRGMIIVTPGKY